MRVLGYAVNGVADELSLAMLAQVIDDLPIALQIAGARMQASELVALAKGQQFSVVCLADLPPSAPSKTRYLIKRVRAALPEIRIVVGRWGPAALADETGTFLRDAGANLVVSTLMETRSYLAELVEIPRLPVQETSGVVDESTRKIAPNNHDQNEFHISKPNGWPAGKYKVEVFLDDRSVETKNFEVRAN